MYKHILISTDGSQLSQEAVRHGLALAKTLNAKVTALTVILPFEAAALWEGAVTKTPESYDKRAKAIAADCLSQVTKAAAGSGHKVNTVTSRAKFPWKAIVDAADTMHCDLIVMASHGWKGVYGVLLGSETQKVLTHSKVPVLVYR